MESEYEPNQTAGIIAVGRPGMDIKKEQESWRPSSSWMRGVFGHAGLEVGLHGGWTKSSDWLGRLLPWQRSIFGMAGQGLRRRQTGQEKLRRWTGYLGLWRIEEQRTATARTGWDCVYTGNGEAGVDYIFGRSKPKAAGGRRDPAVLLAPNSLAEIQAKRGVARADCLSWESRGTGGAGVDKIIYAKPARLFREGKPGQRWNEAKSNFCTSETSRPRAPGG